MHSAERSVCSGPVPPIELGKQLCCSERFANREASTRQFAIAIHGMPDMVGQPIVVFRVLAHRRGLFFQRRAETGEAGVGRLDGCPGAEQEVSRGSLPCLQDAWYFPPS
jgi:hypothetical protein